MAQVAAQPWQGLLPAEAYGGETFLVLDPATGKELEFPEAFERALAEPRPSLLELRVDPEAITPRQTLSEIRAEAIGSVQR